MSLNTRTTHARPDRHEAGIASLEFVMILPVLLILLFGVMEYGWMLAKSGEVVNAAREGAREGARADATNADINAVVDARMSAAKLNGYTVTITNAPEVGDPVTVVVVQPYDGNAAELTGFFSAPFLPVSLRASVSMAKEGP